MSLGKRAKTLFLWPRALWFWAVEPRHFWIAVFVAAMALLFTMRRGVSEPETRIAGLVLQLLGIGTVAWGIRETRALFGHPSLLTLSRNWLRRFPPYGGRIVSGSISITESGDTVHGRGYGFANAGPEATVEARVETLERNVKFINERIDQAQGEMDQEFQMQAQLLTEEQQTRTKGDQEIREKLEATETGGLHISAMGALWLFLGVTLSTAAPEISRCLN